MELIKEFSKDEILTALKQMHPTKALGPNDLSAIFFHKYQNIVGNSVTNMALNVHNSNMPIIEINNVKL